MKHIDEIVENEETYGKFFVGIKSKYSMSILSFNLDNRNEFTTYPKSLIGRDDLNFLEKTFHFLMPKTAVILPKWLNIGDQFREFGSFSQNVRTEMDGVSYSVCACVVGGCIYGCG